MALTIESSSQIHTRTGIITAAGTLLPANDNRRTIIIQNLGREVLFVKFGSDASSTDFDVILKAGSANDDGLGGVLSYDVLSYTGIISVAGNTVRCTATDF